MFDFFAKKQPFQLDPALGDQLAKAILSEARQGKARTFLQQVARLRQGQWDRRAFYADLAGKHFSDPSAVPLIPDTPLGLLLKGSIAIHRGWKARGTGTADTVSADGWQQFFHHLNVAGERLTGAAEGDPEDPTPFAFLQTVAQGLQLERRIADLWLQRALERDPLNQQAHYRHLFLLCKKWGGSHEEMYAFARATVDRLQTNSTLHSILYLAFQEHVLYLEGFENDSEGVRRLLKDKDVMDETLAVYRKSLYQRPRIEQVSDYWPHNVATWWFLVMGLPVAVRYETKKIGMHFTEFPWRIFYADPGAGYQRALEFAKQ